MISLLPFYTPHKVDGGGFFSQMTTLKTVPSDEKSNCRTCAEGCQMPFKRTKNETSTSTSTDVKRHRTNIPTDVTPNVTSVQRSASNIQAQIDQLKQMMEELDKANQNEKSKSYSCLLSECTDKLKRGKDKETMKKINKRHNTRGKAARQKRHRATHETNKQHIKNLSDTQLTNDQINLLSKGA